MEKPTTFVLSAGLGFWFSILILTGIDTSEEGFASHILDSLSKIYTSYSELFSWYSFLISAISLIGPIYLACRVYSEGKVGIVAFLGGFVGVIALLFGMFNDSMLMLFGLMLLAVGVLVESLSLQDSDYSYTFE